MFAGLLVAGLVALLIVFLGSSGSDDSPSTSAGATEAAAELAPEGVPMAGDAVEEEPTSAEVGPEEGGAAEDAEPDEAVSSLGADDHGNSAATATPLAVPSTTGGVLEGDADEDWFSFSAAAGQTFSIRIQPVIMQEATLEVFDSDGTTLLAFGAEAGEASSIMFAPPSAGTFFVVVRGSRGPDRSTS